MLRAIHLSIVHRKLPHARTHRPLNLTLDTSLSLGHLRKTSAQLSTSVLPHCWAYIVVVVAVVDDACEAHMYDVVFIMVYYWAKVRGFIEYWKKAKKEELKEKPPTLFSPGSGSLTLPPFPFY